MRTAIVFCLSLGICVAADPKPAPASAEKPVVKPEQIPAGAVEMAPGYYRFTDAQGVAWVLSRSPFGVMAVREKTLETAIRATGQGDVVRFVETTPFGSRSWERKGSELSPAERAIWEHQRDGGAAK